MNQPRLLVHRHPWLALLGTAGCGSMLLCCLLLLLLGLALLSALAPLAGMRAVDASARPGTFPAAGSQGWRGPANETVVSAALSIASALYPGPPDGYDTWYHAESIPAAIAYWQRTCPGCAAWAQGNLQCVMLVTAAYGLAGQPLPYSGNAITFWTSGAYRRQAGWAMVPPGALPYPGDMLVLDSGANFQGVGHIAIIVDVTVPAAPGGPGSAQFAEANGPGAILRMPLREDASGRFTLATWRGYTVMGYIRHTAALAPV